MPARTVRRNPAPVQALTSPALLPALRTHWRWQIAGVVAEAGDGQSLVARLGRPVELGRRGDIGWRPCVRAIDQFDQKNWPMR